MDPVPGRPGSSVLILDTNVLSALMQARPNTVVVDWVDRQSPESIWLTSITVFETRFGLALLPTSKRRAALEESFERLLQDDLQGRVLPFDEPAAAKAAALAAERQRAGRSIDLRDTLIAAIAVARNASLATRNVKHFADLPIPVLNPWQ